MQDGTRMLVHPERYYYHAPADDPQEILNLQTRNQTTEEE
jgi:hypothetical protein